MLVIALQLEHTKPLTWTETSLAFVASHVLLLLLLLASLKLQECAPTCNTLIDPPYEFAPKEKANALVNALESTEYVFCTRTLMPLALVDPHVLLLSPDEL